MYIPKLTVANNVDMTKIKVIDADKNEIYYCPFCSGKLKARALYSNKIKPHFYHIEHTICMTKTKKTNQSLKCNIRKLEVALDKYKSKCNLNEDMYKKLHYIILNIQIGDIDVILKSISDIRLGDTLWLLHELKKQDCNYFYKLYFDDIAYVLLHTYITRNNENPVYLNDFARIYRDIYGKTNQEMANMLGLKKACRFQRFIAGYGKIYGEPKMNLLKLLNSFS